MCKTISLFLIFLPFLLTGQTIDSVAIKTVDSLITVSTTLTEEGAQDQAFEVCTAAEKIALEKLGQESASYGACCHLHSAIVKSQGDYAEAEKWLLEALTIREKVLGKEHRDYSKSLNGLALIYWEMGDFDKAEPLFLESSIILEKLDGKETLDYAYCLGNLGNLYADMGNYEKAESNYLIAKAIQQKISGKTDPHYCGSLINLGFLYIQIGNYETSEQHLLEAKSIFEDSLNDTEHPYYVNCINGLAILYAAIGNFEKAESFALQANDIWEKLLGKEDPDYAIGLLNLASLYSEMGRFEKVESIYLEAAAIFEKVLGKEAPHYAMCLANLANSYYETGQYEKSEPICLEALALREKILGKEHPDYAFNLFNLGALYHEMGDFKKAESLYLESKSIYEHVLGKEHSDYTYILHNLGMLYIATRNYEKAEALLTEHAALHRALIANATNYLSEQELYNYLNQFAGKGQAEMLSLAQKNTNNNATLAAISYDNILFYKGYLLMASSQIKRLALANATASDKFNLLKSYERRLATEYTLPIAERTKVAELEGKAIDLEKDLARSVAGFGEAVRQVNWREIQNTLKPGEAAIEFVHYKLGIKNTPALNPSRAGADSIMYAALVLLPDDKGPRFIPLFEEKQLDALLLKQAKSKSEQINTRYRSTDKQSLYSLIWSPIEQSLNGIKTIYFSPSGLLHRLNLGALSIPAQTDQTIADHYRLVALGSTRQLVVPATLESITSTALLYGGIQYELDSIVIAKANASLHDEPLATRGSMNFANMHSSLRGDAWNYLKWTAVEVNATEVLLSEAGIKPTILSGHSATEESFKAIGTSVPSPRILHIATHGFFFPDPQNKKGQKASNNAEEPVFKVSDHPMIRSGLILAGGNHAWKTGLPAKPGMEDGILTAYEISKMNLSNTELVVLSACETGLGDIQGNEGVYGLQRAFKIAGVKYLIMSLWQVPDFQTQELMTSFYSHWIEDKMTVPDAFRAAQKTMKAKYKDPFLWAGFVLVE